VTTIYWKRNNIINKGKKIGKRKRGYQPYSSNFPSIHPIIA